MTCREFRSQHGYTLNDLSIATGYSISAISKWERENDTMPEDFVEKVQKHFGVVIVRQFRKFIFNDKHNNAMAVYQNELNELYEELDKMSNENAKLKEKIAKISQMCNNINEICKEV